MSSLEDILYEWAKGPFRLSTEDSLVVMARLAELEARERAVLTPVEVFGDETLSYGLSDAVFPWSDCNRACGHVYRFEDLSVERDPGESLEVWADPEALAAFRARTFGDDDGLRLTVAQNQLRNAMGAVIDSGGYCEGPHDVADAIYRLTAERDALRALIDQARRLIGEFGSMADGDEFYPDFEYIAAVRSWMASDATRARSAVGGAPGVSETHTDPATPAPPATTENQA